MKLSDFLRDIGRPVAYYPALTKITGGVTQTILLCQLLYWTGKEAGEDGWIYKTQKELTQEIGLSRREQEGARAILKGVGLLSDHYARIEHRLYYKVNIARLNEMWNAAFPYTEAASTESPMPGKASTKPPFGNVHLRPALNVNIKNENPVYIPETTKPPFVHTETTTEITTEKGPHEVDEFSVSFLKFLKERNQRNLGNETKETSGTSLQRLPTEITPKSIAPMIDESFRVRMREKYGGILSEVDQRIDEALAHVNAKKWSNKQLYVQGWLRRDAERANGGQNGNAIVGRDSPRYKGPDKVIYDGTIGQLGTQLRGNLSDVQREGMARKVFPGA